MNSPNVSIIMPVYNGEQFLRAAVNSILVQTYRKFELIVIDDASSDHTWKILKSYKDPRIRLVKLQKSLGIAQALNLGLKKAQGEYIARMDSDDISLPDRLKIQINFLESHQKIDLVGSWVELIDHKGVRIGVKRMPITSRSTRQRLVRANPLIHPSVVWRRKLFDRYGGYDSELEGAEDYDLWARYLRYSEAVNIPAVLLKYRLRKESVSFSESNRVSRAYAKAQLKKVFIYKYPYWHLVFAVKGIISSYVPSGLKQVFYRLLYHY